ncbi:hypothetical protein ABZ379_23105 [Streptomyces canus]
MAVLVAASLLERGGLDLPDIFARFHRWAASEPKDIGLLPWETNPGNAGHNFSALGHAPPRAGTSHARPSGPV